MLCIFMPLNAEIHYELNPVSFEDGSIPAGWSIDTLWTVEGGAGVTLDYPNGCADGVYRAVARCASGTFSAVSAKMMTPALNLTESSSPLLVFSYAAPAYEGHADTLVVSYRTNATDSWHQIQSLTRAAAWTEVEIELPNYISGSAYQVQFEMAHDRESVKGVAVDNIFIYKAPTCNAPSIPTFDVWQDSLYVEMNGIPGGGISSLYDVILSKTAIDPDTVTDFSPYVYHAASMVENWLELGGLEPFTKYYFYARTNCDDNRTGYTDWTLHEFRSPMLIDLPYAENFNSATTLPDGWLYGSSAGLSGVPAVLAKNNYYSVDSTNCLFFGASKSSPTSSTNAPLVAGQYVYAAMPQFREVNIKNVQLSFWGAAYTFVGGLYAPHIEVGVMADPEDIATFAKVADLTIESQYQFKKYTVDFGSYNGDGRHVAFVVRGADVTNLFAIDNIQVINNANIVPVPAQPVLKAITPTSMTLEVALHGATSWNLLVGESYVHDGVPAALLSQNGISGNTYTVALSDTLANHVLTVYAQGVKGGVAGEWSFPLTVRVPAQIADTLPWKETFTSTTPTLLLKSLNNELHTTAATKVPASVYFKPELISASAPSLSSNKLKLANGTYAALGYAASYNNREVVFYLNGGSTTTLTKVALGVMTNPYDAATFVELAQFEGALSSSEYARCIYDFDNYDDAAHYLAFKVLEGTALVQEIDITTIPTCREVAVADVQLQGAKTASFSWNANNMSQWQVVLATDKAMTDVVASEIVNTPNCTINGLQSTTTYYYKVNTICGEDTVQMYGNHSFTTPFGLPMVETFSGLTTGIPAGWDNAEGTTTSASYRWTYYTSGNPAPCVRFNSYSNSTGNTNYLKTPVLAIDDENVRLTFDYMNPTGGGFAVYYSVVGGNRVLLDSMTQVATWKTFTYLLPDSVKNRQIQIQFLGVSNWGSGDAYLYLDNVKVESFDPNCVGVTALSARSTNDSTVQVTWQAGGAQSVQLTYYIPGDASFVPVVVENVTASPYTISGLVSNTTYVVEAVQSCDLSGDTLSTEVHTMCGAIAPEAFGVETFSSNANIPCWAFGLDTVGTAMSATTYASCLPKVEFVSGFGQVLSFNKQINTTTYKYGNDYYAILPLLDVDSISKYQLVLDAAAPTAGLSSNARTLIVGVSLNQSVAMSGIDTLQIAPAADSTAMSHYVIPFDAYKGDRYGRQGKYIVLKVSADESHSNQIYIDNVSIEPVSHCKQITSVEVESIYSDGAVLSWNKANADQFEVIVSDTLVLNAALLDSVHIKYSHIVSELADSITGLSPNKAYYAYVRSVCGENDYSVWSAAASFRTECVAISSFPWTEDFESFAAGFSKTAPDCWSFLNANESASSYPRIQINNSSSYVHEGSNSLYWVSSSTVFAYAVLPNIENVHTKGIRFWYKDESLSSSGKLWVGYMTNPAVDTTFVVIDEVPRSTAFVQANVSLDEVPAGARVAFKYGGASNNYYLGIDDIEVYVLPTCPDPKRLEVSDVTVNSALAKWSGTSAAYNVDVVLGTDTVASYHGLEVDSVLITGLAHSTAYKVCLQGICGEESTAVISTTFNTPLAIPYAEEWETTLPSDWSRLSGDIFSNAATSTTSGWSLTTSAGGGMTTSHAYYGAYHYYSTYYGTHTYYKYSLVTPEMVMLNEAGNHIKLSFDLALTTGSSNSTAPTPDACVGHTFAVLVSTDGGKTWNTDSTMILTGADYAAIPSTATSYEFDLTAFAGENAMIAFYHGVDSTAPGVSSSTTYINLDKIKLQSVNLSCLAPQLEAVGAGLDSLVIALNGDAAQYEIECASNASFSGAQSLTVAADTAVIKGLSHSTIYYVRARALCGGAQSSWSDPIQTVTLCAPLTEYPWSEDFEVFASGELSAPCFINMPWKAGTGTSGSTGLVFKVYTSTNGSNATHQLQLPDQSAGTQTRLYLPEMLLDASKAYFFDIDVYRNATSRPKEGIRVFYVDEDDNEVELAYISRDYTVTDGNLIPAESKSDWYTYSMPLPHDGRVYRVLIQGESDYGSSTYMDNLQVREMDANCVPVHINVLDIQAESATIHLDTVANDYMVVVAKNATFTQGLDTVYVTNDTVATISNLAPATQYYVRCYVVCGENLYSEVSNVVGFMTDCMLAAIPYFEGFEGMATGSTSSPAPTCWWISPENNGSAPYAYVSTTAKTGTKSFYAYGSSYTDKFVMLPKMDAELKMLRLNFSYRAASSSSYNYLRVGYLRTVDNMVVTMQQLDLSSTSWRDVTIDFNTIPDSIGNNYRIAFYISGSVGLYIDDINVVVRPQDETLVGVTTSNVERRSFDIEWTPKAETACEDYDLVISKTALSAAALDTMEYIKPDTTVYHAAGLDRNTTYYIYVRTSCAVPTAAHGKWFSTTVTTKNIGPDCSESTPGEISITGTGSAYAPISAFYKNSYVEQIYTSSELHAAGLSAGYVSKVAFQYLLSSSYTKSVTVYVGSTNDAQVGSSFYKPEAASDEQSITFDTADKWYEMELSTPYYWDGTSNLVIGVRAMGSDYWGSGVAGFAAGATTNNTVLYARSDTNDPHETGSATANSLRPDIKFSICPAGSACPKVAVVSVAAITSSSATINWTASKADYLGSYEVILSDTAITDLSTVTPQYVGIDSLSLPLTGLAEHNNYYVYVHAVCNAEGKDDGTSDWTMATFQTKADCNALENVKAAVTGKTSAVISWDASAQTANYCYVLSLSEIAAEDLDAIAKTAEHLTDTFAVLSGLENDTTYYVYVANECGEGTYSPFEQTTFHTLATCVPVSNFHAEMVAFNAVQLAWGRGLYGEETEWEVGIVGNAASVQTVVDSSVIIIGLNAETEYTFYVKAVCDADDSSLAQTLTLTTPVAPGDAVEIGGDGITSATAYPTNAFFNYTTSEQIYTAEEIGNSGNILSVAFRVVDQNTATRDLKVYLKHVVESEFASITDWIAVDDADLVFEGEYTFTPNDWNVIDIAGFEYNGSDNLLVVVDDNTGSYVTSGTQPTFATYGVEDYQNLYSNSDSNNFDPTNPGSITGTRVTTKDQIQIVFESGSCPKAAKLQVSNITRTEAKVSWFPGGSETKWAVALADHELSDTELASVAADTLDHVMTKTYTGLTPDMDYYFYIRSLCSATERGDWKFAHFVTLPTCEVPVGLELDSITAHTAKLKWNKLNALYTGSYTLAYGLADAFDLANAATYQTAAATDTFVTVSGLQALSVYKFAIRANCGPDDDSRWSASIDAMTDCDVVSTFPYVESFDDPNKWYTSGSNQYHYCWPVGGSSTSYYPRIQTNTATYRYAYSDTAALYIYTYSGSSNYSIVATPELEGDLDTLRLRFKMRACYQSISTGNVSTGYYSSSYAHAIKVGSAASLQNITINPLATFTLKKSFAYGDALNEANNYGWEEFELYLTGVTDPYLVFYSDFASSNYVWIDDITIEPLPACQRPVIVADSIAADYAKFSWQEGSDYWRGYLVDGNDTVATYDTIRVNSLVLDSIQGATTYKLYLQSVCGSDASDWAEYEFTTLCAVISTYPWLEDFSKVEIGAIANCWDNSEGTTTDASNRFVGYSSNGNMCMRFNSYSNSRGKTNILVTPELAIVENMKFSFSYKNPDGGSLAVKVSYDDGATFTTLATLDQEAAWTIYEYNFDQFAGKTVRVYFEATSNYGNNDAYIYLDNVMLNTYNANCLGVEDVTVSAGAHGADVAFRYVAGNRDAVVEVSNRADFANIVFTDSLTNDSVCHITDLKPATTYYVRIKQLCDEGEESSYTSVNFTTAFGAPYAPDFSDGIPANWTRYSYLVKDAVPQFATADFATTSSGWSKTAKDTVINADHIRGEIWSTSFRYWLVSPAIDLSDNVGDGVMLNVDLGLTPFSSYYRGQRDSGDDDRFMIVVSEDGGLTWDLANATIWDNVDAHHAQGISYSYNDVPEHAETYRIDLTNYTGKSIALGFYGESTVSNADNYFHFGNIRVNAIPATQVYDSICNGYDYAGYGFSVSFEDYQLGENIYSHITPAIDSLHTDSVTTLHLFVKPTAKYVFNDTICAGEAYMKNGFEIMNPNSGNYSLHMPGANGCDSVVTLSLYVIPRVTETVEVRLCKGETYEFHGVKYATDQVLRDTLVSSLGCDSIVLIDLQFSSQSSYASAHRELICMDASYSDDLFSDLTLPGVYVKDTTTIFGCDSTVTLTLLVADVNKTAYDTIKVDELPYVLNGLTLLDLQTEPGEYELTLTSDCGFITVNVFVDGATGLNHLHAIDNKARKVFVDGKVYIVINDNWYDAQGKPVQSKF